MLKGKVFCFGAIGNLEEYKQKVTALGATIAIFIHERVDFLVAVHTHKQKYRLAVKWHIPIVSPGLIDSCKPSGNSSDLQTLTIKFALPPLSNCRISAAGLSHFQKSIIRSLVVSLGGDYSEALTEDCTHLIDCSGELLEVCSRWNVALVSLKWLHACSFGRVDESPYCISETSSIADVATISVDKLCIENSEIDASFAKDINVKSLVNPELDVISISSGYATPNNDSISSDSDRIERDFVSDESDETAVGSYRKDTGHQEDTLSEYHRLTVAKTDPSDIILYVVDTNYWISALGDIERMMKGQSGSNIAVVVAYKVLQELDHLKCYKNRRAVSVETVNRALNAHHYLRRNRLKPSFIFQKEPVLRNAPPDDIIMDCAMEYKAKAKVVVLCTRDQNFAMKALANGLLVMEKAVFKPGSHEIDLRHCIQRRETLNLGNQTSAIAFEKEMNGVDQQLSSFTSFSPVNEPFVPINTQLFVSIQQHGQPVYNQKNSNRPMAATFQYPANTHSHPIPLSSIPFQNRHASHLPISTFQPPLNTYPQSDGPFSAPFQHQYTPVSAFQYPLNTNSHQPQVSGPFSIQFQNQLHPYLHNQSSNCFTNHPKACFIVNNRQLDAEHSNSHQPNNKFLKQKDVYRRAEQQRIKNSLVGQTHGKPKSAKSRKRSAAWKRVSQDTGNSANASTLKLPSTIGNSSLNMANMPDTTTPAISPPLNLCKLSILFDASSFESIKALRYAFKTFIPSALSEKQKIQSFTVIIAISESANKAFETDLAKQLMQTYGKVCPVNGIEFKLKVLVTGNIQGDVTAYVNFHGFDMFMCKKDDDTPGYIKDIGCFVFQVPDL